VSCTKQLAARPFSSLHGCRSASEHDAHVQGSTPNSSSSATCTWAFIQICHKMNCIAGALMTLFARVHSGHLYCEGRGWMSLSSSELFFSFRCRFLGGVCALFSSLFCPEA